MQQVRPIFERPNPHVAVGAEERTDSAGFVTVVDGEFVVTLCTRVDGHFGLAADRTRSALLREHSVVVGGSDSVPPALTVLDGSLPGRSLSPRLDLGRTATLADSPPAEFVVAARPESAEVSDWFVHSALRAGARFGWN